MFTGLVADLGTVTAVTASTDGVVLSVTTSLTPQIRPGDSVATNGVCLTAVSIDGAQFRTEVMNETLRRSSLGELTPGSPLNLELAMRVGDRLGGHLVQGHVDGVGTVTAVVEDGFARRLTVAAPAPVMRYIVHKGSITVDGVSLTVAEAGERSFTVSLIPETLERTNLGVAGPGTIVNLEVDIVAKYVEKLTAVAASTARSRT